MNRELLEALGALAAEDYFDAMSPNPGLFSVTVSRRSPTMIGASSPFCGSWTS